MTAVLTDQPADRTQGSPVIDFESLPPELSVADRLYVRASLIAEAEDRHRETMIRLLERVGPWQPHGVVEIPIAQTLYGFGLIRPVMGPAKLAADEVASPWFEVIGARRDDL